MKVALLQLDPTVGAIEDNTRALLEASKRARAAGARLAVASELVIPGYPPRDLLDRPAFVRATEQATQQVVANVPEGLVLAFGTVGRRGDEPARPLTNEAVIAERGRILGRAVKRLLPTYDVFDEARHFSAGARETIVVVDGLRLAVTVCEDAWGKAAHLVGRYDDDPLDTIGPDRVDVLLNLSASPFTLTKLDERPRLFSRIAKEHHVRVVLVNQVGGNDELLFDGRSAIFETSGHLAARAKAFEEDLLIAELGEPARIEPEPATRAEAAYRALVLGVRDYAKKCGFRRAVIGLSGGIDSAVTACIAAEALGPDNVLGIAMPTRYSSEGSVTDARDLGTALGITFRVIDVDPIFQVYLEQLGPILDEVGPAPPLDVTLENIQARVRGATLMALSNRTGALVLTTGNKSEIAVGYCTLYGDMVGGLAVISDVPKTMVYSIARFINGERPRIPDSTIEKPPSAELRPNQKDEDSLPPYEVLDRIVELSVEQQLSRSEILAHGFEPEVVDRTLHLIRTSEYKRRQAAPGLIITTKAFGSGRRMPIAQGYRE